MSFINGDAKTIRALMHRVVQSVTVGDVVACQQNASTAVRHPKRGAAWQERSELAMRGHEIVQLRLWQE